MLNETEEFKEYTDFPVYEIRGKRDNAYLGRFTLDMMKDHKALSRVLTIVARGYMWETDEPDVERARRALCAWCSLPEAVIPKRAKAGQSETCFFGLHAEFPELVDENGAGWFYRHVHSVIGLVLKNRDKATEFAVSSCLVLRKGFDDAWLKKVMQLQTSLYSRKTAGWVMRFDDILASAKEQGPLKNRDFDLPEETVQFLKDQTPKGVPENVLPTLYKYYAANKPDDSDWVVLPVVNFNAFFRTTSFDRKWLPAIPETVLKRENRHGVCRFKICLTFLY